ARTLAGGPGRPPERSAESEPALSVRSLGGDVDRGHHGRRRPAPAPGHSPLHRRRPALETGLDPTVGEVAAPPGHTLPLGHAAARPPEPDALHPARDDDPPPDDLPVVHGWHVSHRNVDRPPSEITRTGPPQPGQGSPSRP